VGQFFDRKEDYSYIRWAHEVKRRDNYTCVICNRRGVALNSHHLNAWAHFPTQRYDVDNGITLCLFHHEDFHERFGRGENTEAQFKEYREIAETLIKVANQETIINVTSRRMLQQAERDRVTQELIKDLDERYGTKDGYG
jgi:predicted restriction endonuclease